MTETNDERRARDQKRLDDIKAQIEEDNAHKKEQETKKT